MKIKLSARFMDYCLDCWGSDCEVPEGETNKRYWTGDVTKEQLKEVKAQADHHADMQRYSEYRDPDLKPFIDIAIRAKAYLDTL